MKKKLEADQLAETEGPMNSVALDDARTYLGLDGKEELTVDEFRALRAKKKKIITSSKKLDRRVSHEVTRQAKRED